MNKIYLFLAFSVLLVLPVFGQNIGINADGLAGKNKDALSLFSDEKMSNSFTSLGKDAADPIYNWILKSNIDQLHRFTLAIGSGEVFSTPGASGIITSLKICPIG